MLHLLSAAAFMAVPVFLSWSVAATSTRCKELVQSLNAVRIRRILDDLDP